VAPSDSSREGVHEVVAALAEQNANLQRALDSRVVIEQAKGVLAERFELDVTEAFELLRRSARSNRMRLHDLAEQVVASRETPAEIDR
jgi:AmiR/NasT family two-component response regulator